MTTAPPDAIYPPMSKHHHTSRQSGSQQNGSWLVGHHAVTRALEVARRPVYEILCTDKHADTYRELAAAKGIRVQVVDRQRLDGLSDQPHQGVAASVGPLPEPKLKDLFESDLLVMLDQVTDPHNVGACVRSANAFGAAAVLVPSHHAPKDSPIIAKAAAGALEDTPLVSVGNLNQALDGLKKEGFWVVGLDGHTETDLHTVDLKGKIVLVMGSEGEGMRQLVRQNCDFLARLPMVGTVESLNVSVATGIALYEVRRQRHANK